LDNGDGMWKITRFKTKEGQALPGKTQISFNDVVLSNVCSYNFGAELQPSDIGNGMVAVDTLELKLQMPSIEIKEEIVDSAYVLDSKYSEDEISPTKEDKQFSVNLLQKSFAADLKKNDGKV